MIPTDLFYVASDRGFVSPSALTVQTGYLTIREKTSRQTVRIAFPNLDVAQGMAGFLAEEMLGTTGPADADVLNFPSALALRSEDDVFKALNRIFRTVNYDNYPVRDEPSLRFGLQMLLVGGALMPLSEVHGVLRRSDLEVKAGRRHWVFELKYAKNATEVDRLLEEGVERIRSRRYDLATDTRELLRTALVFDGETRQFAAWRRAD